MRTLAVDPYMDGDSPDWEWSGTPHASESHESTMHVEEYDDPTETDVTAAIVDNTYTLDMVDESCILCVEFGPATS